MAIDIKELRKVIADCYWPTSPVTINELLDRLEAAESEALEQARLNGMGSSREAALAARLEAAEKERDKLKELNIALCTKSNSQVIHNARLAEENDALRTENAALVEDMNLLRNNNMTLRAKIEAMEKQEPVAWMHETRRDSDVVTDAVKHVWGKVAVGSMAAYSIPLYTLPGAQPAPSDEYVGWYCAHCERGVDASEVTYHEQHQVCGRVITDDKPPKPAPSVPEGWQLVPTAESRHPGIYKMLGALHAADNTPGMSEWESYRAMLAAAPEAKP